MKNFPRYFGGFLAFIVFVGSIYGIVNKQQILDYLALRNYSPNSRVVELADQTTMQDKTRRVFYVNHPELNNKEDFKHNCPTGEQSIVLGCYIQGDGIFLHDVTDERLSGVVQVTAAHEVLHAEYDRLSSADRKRIDKLTNDFFRTLSDDRIKKTVEQYKVKDPTIVPNELHSILGTEVRNLSPELEQYYARYFINRAKIVDYSEKYEQTFVDLTSQVENYDKQLAKLKSEIESNQLEIEGLSKDLDLQKSRLDSLMNSGRTDEYNAAVPTYNTLVNQYNGLINRTRALVTEHNSIVERRNQIATTEQELVEAINPNTTPKQIQ